MTSNFAPSRLLLASKLLPVWNISLQSLRFHRAGRHGRQTILAGARAMVVLAVAKKCVDGEAEAEAAKKKRGFVYVVSTLDFLRQQHHRHRLFQT